MDTDNILVGVLGSLFNSLANRDVGNSQKHYLKSEKLILVILGDSTVTH